jgi:hypothetical protein
MINTNTMMGAMSMPPSAGGYDGSGINPSYTPMNLPTDVPMSKVADIVQGGGVKVDVNNDPQKNIDLKTPANAKVDETPFDFSTLEENKPPYALILGGLILAFIVFKKMKK